MSENLLRDDRTSLYYDDISKSFYKTKEYKRIAIEIFKTSISLKEFALNFTKSWWGQTLMKVH
jgi:hypothetical protein